MFFKMKSIICLLLYSLATKPPNPRPVEFRGRMVKFNFIYLFIFTKFFIYPFFYVLKSLFCNFLDFLLAVIVDNVVFVAVVVDNVVVVVDVVVCLLNVIIHTFGRPHQNLSLVMVASSSSFMKSLLYGKFPVELKGTVSDNGQFVFGTVLLFLIIIS